MTDRADQPDGGGHEEQDLLECRKCGCRHLPVYYTRQRGRQIIRVRYCRNCGELKTTIERESGTS